MTPTSPSTEALRGIAVLLILQATGEAVARALSLPFPGPVVGLVLLLPALAFGPLRTPVAAAAEVLLGHLSLLFVPVGVGVVTHLAVISEHGLRLLAVIVVSTWIGIVVTALTLRALSRPGASREAEHG